VAGAHHGVGLGVNHMAEGLDLLQAVALWENSHKDETLLNVDDL
jgi:hypothetical protein